MSSPFQGSTLISTSTDEYQLVYASRICRTGFAALIARTEVCIEAQKVIEQNAARHLCGPFHDQNSSAGGRHAGPMSPARTAVHGHRSKEILRSFCDQPELAKGQEDLRSPANTKPTTHTASPSQLNGLLRRGTYWRALRTAIQCRRRLWSRQCWSRRGWPLRSKRLASSIMYSPL